MFDNDTINQNWSYVWGVKKKRKNRPHASEGENWMRVVETRDYELLARLNKPVHDLHVELYPEYFEAYKYETLVSVFQKQMENEANIFLVIEDEGDPVGFAWVEVRSYDRFPYKKAYNSIYVHQLSIDAGKRKSGYGTHLMNHIYQLAKDKEIHLVELDYWVKNTNAQKFYDKHGFQPYRETVFKQV